MTQTQIKSGFINVMIPIASGIIAFLISFAVLKTQAEHISVQVSRNDNRITLVESNINQIKVDQSRLVTILEYQTKQIEKLLDK